MQVKQFTFNNNVVEFDLTQKNVMVNATQMAKIFDKQIVAFMRNDSTESFLKACLNSENSHYLGIEKEEELYTSKQKTGTWMHRVLALKFAAWLDPNFELWVYMTIDQLLFSHSKSVEESLKESAKRKSRIIELKNKLNADAEFLELQKLETEERHAAYVRSKSNSQQISMFQDLFSGEEGG